MSNTETAANIAVYDVTGRKLYNENNQLLGSNPYQINVKDYVPGVYIVNIVRGNGVKQMFKFVKQ